MTFQVMETILAAHLTHAQKKKKKKIGAPGTPKGWGGGRKSKLPAPLHIGRSVMLIHEVPYRSCNGWQRRSELSGF